MTLKFNGGNPTLLCDHCATIVAMGNDLPKGVLFDPGYSKYTMPFFSK